jgi:hypothetical protein
MSWTSAKAIITWSPEWLRKRKEPGAGQRYEGVGDWGGLAENPWSVLVIFDEPLDVDCRGRATVTLRAHWAPAELLAQGMRFFIIEGRTRIGEVHVLDDSRQTESSPSV